MYKRIVSSAKFQPVEEQSIGEASPGVLARFAEFQQVLKEEKLGTLDSISLTDTEQTTLRTTKALQFSSEKRLTVGAFYHCNVGVVYVDNGSEGQQYSLSLMGSSDA